jgi:hypothetical protein
MALPLYTRHSPGLAAVYADVEINALHREAPLVGTPGSLTVRQNASGSQFPARGKKSRGWRRGRLGSRLRGNDVIGAGMTSPARE